MYVPGNAQQASDTRKQIGALLHSSIEWIREKIRTFIREAVGGALVLAVPEKNELIGLLHRQSLEHHRVDETEDRRIRADSKRERKHCDEREARFFKKNA